MPERVLKQAQRNWQSLALAAIVALVLIYGDLGYAIRTQRSLDTLHAQICTVVQKGEAGDPALRDMWLASAAKATREARREPHLAGPWLALAENERRIADVYDKASTAGFPGC